MDPLLAAACAARRHARPLRSGYAVGAALRDAEGRIFAGCNAELPALDAHHASLHAEQGAIAHLLAAGGCLPVTELVVVGGPPGGPAPTPCGHCREYLATYAEPDALVRCATPDGAIWVLRRVGELLPHRSGPVAREWLYDLDRLADLAPPSTLAGWRDLLAAGPGPSVLLVAAGGGTALGRPREEAAYTGTSAVRTALAALDVAGAGAPCLAIFGPHPAGADHMFLPPGRDLQALAEAAGEGALAVLAVAGPAFARYALGDLLPLPFGWGALAVPGR